VSTSSPLYEYQDDGTRVAVDLTGGGSIRVRAAAGGVGSAIELTVVGAQRLATMLGGATSAIHRGLPGGSTD
jgi:hypothetical protein